jgi:hypothetical protein
MSEEFVLYKLAELGKGCPGEEEAKQESEITSCPKDI